jgi:DNA-binding transcriptional regulator GbsR (MarR family)
MPEPDLPAPQRDEAEVREFVERSAMLFAHWGFPRMPARVLFALMVAEEPSLTAPQLAERLHASAAAISGAVRYLQQLNILERHPVPGSRADHYRLPEDTWYTTSKPRGSYYRRISELADEGAEVVGPESTAGKRLTEMGEFFAFMQEKVTSIMEEWKAIESSRS